MMDPPCARRQLRHQHPMVTRSQDCTRRLQLMPYSMSNPGIMDQSCARRQRRRQQPRATRSQDSTRRCEVIPYSMSNPAVMCKRALVSSCHKLHFCLRKWDELDDNLLMEIFSRVPKDDLLMNVSWVCRSWHCASLSTLFWTNKGVLDLTPVVVAVMSKRRDNDKLYSSTTTQDGGLNLNLMKLLRHLLEGGGTKKFVSHDRESELAWSWRQSIQTVILPVNLEVQNEHLLFIAKRTPLVKHLFLLNPWAITSDCIAKVTLYWKNIKELHIGRYPTDEIWFSCFLEIANWESLETLHISNEQQHIMFIQISRPLKFPPGLKRIEFHGGIVFALGITRMFKYGKDQLQEVCFSGCKLLKSPTSCWFDYPQSSIDECIRHGHNTYFNLCRTEGCEGFPVWRAKLTQDDAHYVDFQSDFNEWLKRQSFFFLKYYRFL